MALTTTTLGELLMRTYDTKTVESLQNLATPLLMEIKKAKGVTVQGESIRFAVSATGDESFAYITEDGELPAANNEVVKQAVVTPTVFVGPCKITGLAHAISRGNPGAFAEGLQFNLDQKLKRMSKYKEGALFRDGTGKLGLFSGAPSSATMTVDTPGAQNFRIGMLVDVLDDSTGDKLVSAQRVTAVDRYSNTVTFENDFSAAVGDNDTLHIAGSQPSTGGPVTREILGLGAAVATSGNYLSISRTSYPTWQSVVVNASSTDLDEDLLHRVEEHIMIDGGVDDFSSFKLVMHPRQRRKYFELVSSRMRFSGNSADAEIRNLTWGGNKFVVSDSCPDSTVYAGDLSQWQRFEAPGGEMKIDTTFGPPIRWNVNFDGGISYWREYCQYAVRKPNAFGAITNLNTPSNL